MFDPERDAALMARVQSGDREAFEELYGHYAKPLARFLYHLSWDAPTVEEGVQEVFLRLWRGAKNWRPTGKFSTYLFQIAKNWWINERVRRSRRIRPVPLPENEAAGAEYAGPSGDASPEEAARRAEAAAHVRRAVADLPEKLHVTFVLSEYEGMKYAEIAEVLDIPVGTVKSRMAAAEKALRRRLERLFPGGAP